MSKKPHIHPPLTLEKLPEPIFYFLRSMPEDTIYPPQTHPWGEFVFSFSGVLELQAEGQEFRVPPNFGIWHPAGAEHQGGNRNASEHCSIYIDDELATKRGMPQTTCALLVSPMLREMLIHLRSNFPQPPYSEEEQRLLNVILDQLVITPIAGSFLPDSKDPLMTQVLAYMKDNPGSNDSVKAIANHFGMSERTLARKSLQELQMPLSEWRQRLKVVRAIPLLQQGASVESVALDMGYSTASAFIAMFKRLLGTTPDEYRKSRG